MSWRTAVRALLPFALHALARQVDAAVGTLLHTSLDLPGFVNTALGLLDPRDTLAAVGAWVAGGAALWWVLARWRVRATGAPPGPALAQTAAAFAPLLLRPAVTLLALAALLVTPTYPYGFTLPVALTQDWGIAQDAAALSALLAAQADLFRPLARLPAPRAGGIAFAAFLVYALVTPEWARVWDGHPGNEPKTLRMAVALGHGLTLDVEGVSAAMEDLPARPLGAAAWGAAVTLGRESARMLAALARGPHAVGAGAIRATRITRQTIRGKEGGVFHVLAPGPSLLLAPALRADRWLNLHRGTRGRLAVTLLLWNVLAALAAAAVFRLLREASGRAGLSAALTAVLALLPPYVFYSWQFYPEMLGALALAVALRQVLFAGPWRRTGPIAGLSLLLAFLPWLHQKFLPVWGVLVVMAVVRAVGDLVTARQIAWLVLPQAASLYLFALYNFAITGSVRPDALFLAWGPGGVSSARMGQGLLGLGLDARYGLLPYVPLYLLAAGGLALRGSAATRLRWAVVAVASYYATVAAADNWSGAVCNLGRYIMPATPWAAALAALALAATAGKAGVRALALTLGGWSVLIGAALWRDPHAANDSAVLLARSAIADGNVYLPNLFLRTWADAAPGLVARVLVWTVLAALLGAWIASAARGRAGGSATRAVLGTFAVALVAAFLLERGPSARTVARFPEALAAGPAVVAYLEGARVDGDRAWVSGPLDALVRSREPVPALRVRVEGAAIVRLPRRPPVSVETAGVEIDVPLEAVRTLVGRRGATETLSRLRLEVDAPSPVPIRLSVPGV